jgi:peptidoglycan/xylan/chitin deacetylase (PgdA/CDA1 family)
MRRTAIVSLLLLAAGCSGAPDEKPGSNAAAVTSPTVVTIQFDDGYEDQYAALAILKARGMHATFYVNTGVVGDADHMAWGELADLAAAGNEIAGHTVSHTNLKKLSSAAAREAVCGDRAALFAHGFEPTSFAYPFGAFDVAAKKVVEDCGYNSARGVSGVDSRYTFAETIPPFDAYATRTPPNPKKSTKLSTIQGYVTAAEQHGGGWIQLAFHHLCDGCGAYSISRASFTALLAWLDARALTGTTVKTTAEVIGGALMPPVEP